MLKVAGGSFWVIVDTDEIRKREKEHRRRRRRCSFFVVKTEYFEYVLICPHLT